MVTWYPESVEPWVTHVSVVTTLTPPLEKLFIDSYDMRTTYFRVAVAPYS